jgi:hypothetical protein
MLKGVMGISWPDSSWTRSSSQGDRAMAAMAHKAKHAVWYSPSVSVRGP